MNKIKIHPLSLKSIENGHPWITTDSYSKKFPNKVLLDIYHPEHKKPIGTFVHDPKHPKVKARFWSNPFEENFEKEIEKRLYLAVEKRKSLKRGNIYLSFGEADALPGLFIQYLEGRVLIQFQAYFWKNYLDLIIDTLESIIEAQSYWFQVRIPGERKVSPEFIKGEKEDSFILDEDGIKFKVLLDKYHDIGLYTDMASIREGLRDLLPKSGSMLNLFSYTGAFSLMGLDAGLSVTSVDLSKNYMGWLEENITLNNFDNKKHKSIVKPCDKFIESCQQKFDFIIVDPPSFSSDGKKRKSALDFYKENQEKLFRSLKKKGILVCFLNTHNINRNKFKKAFSKRPIKELKMSKDCSPLQRFPEGDYLKGFLFKN